MLPRVRLWLQALIALGAFGVGVAVAEIAGAHNLGTAFGVGQIVFAVAVVGLLLWT
jgi:hypothetical protein